MGDLKDETEYTVIIKEEILLEMKQQQSQSY